MRVRHAFSVKKHRIVGRSCATARRGRFHIGTKILFRAVPADTASARRPGPDDSALFPLTGRDENGRICARQPFSPAGMTRKTRMIASPARPQGGIAMLTRKRRQTIMLVDDNQANLNMGKNLLKDFYEVYALPSAERLFTFLESVTPDLILLDVLMPNMGGFDVIKILKANTRYAEIPVIFVTSKSEEANELEGLALGAVDYVAKPFSAAILLKRIETHMLIKRQRAELKNLNDNLIRMVTEKTAQVARLQSSIISTIAEIVEFRDAFTGGHITRTQKYMQSILNHVIENDIYADEVLSWENMDYIIAATQLHDLGKVFISDTILNKPGRLTPEEFEIMKTHVTKGVEAIRQMKKHGEDQPFLNFAEIVAGTHHEKWDGSGYPAGLKGDGIPLLGRMMAVADVYDALISARSYKEPFTPEQSAKIIIDGAGVHFDPVFVDIFKKVRDEFEAVTAPSDEDDADDGGQDGARQD